MSRLSGHAWTTLYRAQNLWHDMLARLLGYCNDCPWRPDPGEGAGYSHWRCGWKRGHEGLHRYRNYAWSDDGNCDYVPVPHGRTWPTQPNDRRSVLTRRQQRRRRAWEEQQHAERLLALAPHSEAE
jgi:hypothetical protein